MQRRHDERHLSRTGVLRLLADNDVEQPRFGQAFTHLRIAGRAFRYFRHAARVRSSALSLKYAASPDVEEYAREHGEIGTEMEKEWADVGRFGISLAQRKRESLVPPSQE